MTAGVRVLLVTHYYPPHLGGIEQVAWAEARRLAARGVRVEVLSTDGGHAAGRVVEDGVPVRRMRAWHGLSGRGVPFPLPTPRAVVSTVGAVRRAEIVHVHDTVYLTSWLAALAAVLTRTPYVVTQHVGVVEHPSRLVMGVQRVVRATFARAVLRGASRVLVINPFVQRAVSDLTRGRTGTTVLHNGVDTEVYRPLPPAERDRVRIGLGLPPGVPVVLYVGRFVPKKGFDLVLGSVTEDHLTVFVGGDRPAGTRDARAHFAGSLSSAEVVPYYQVADLFVGASVGESPLTVLEALSCGLPAILHDDPGVRALGLVDADVRFADLRSGGLRKAVERLVHDPHALAGLAVAGRAAAERSVSWDAHVDRLGEVYAEVLGGRPGRRSDRRVVAVVTSYYPPDTGGVQRYAERFVRWLHESPDYEPMVITSHQGWRMRVTREDGVTVVRLPRGVVVSNTPVNPLWPWQIRRLLRRFDVDVVNAHSPVPLMADAAVFFGGRPSMLTYHSGSLVKGGSRFDPLLRAYERLVLPRLFAKADTLVAVSEVSSSRRYGAILIPGGVDTRSFAPSHDPRERASHDLLYVGRIERTSDWKGLHVAIDALAQIALGVPGVRLRIVGDGDAVPDLRHRAVERGVEDLVEWVGALSGEGLASAYRTATALVLPSLTEAENSPLVVLEAMASGTPVIASRVGGVPYLVRDGIDGLLCEPGSSDELARTAVLLLKDPDLARRLGVSARRRAETDYAWPRQLALMVAELDRLTAGLAGADASADPPHADRYRSHGHNEQSVPRRRCS